MVSSPSRNVAKINLASNSMKKQDSAPGQTLVKRISSSKTGGGQSNPASKVNLSATNA